MRKNVLNSPRLLELKKHRRRIWINKIFFSLFALAVIFAGLAYISRIPILNISEIKIIGNKTMDTEMIKKSVEQQISGYYFKFFPKANVLFYPENNIVEELKKEFKKIKDISFSIKDRKILEISLTEREAKYLWCGDTPPDLVVGDLVVGLPSGNTTTQNPKCFFLDDSGFVFDEAPYFSGEVYFKFYGKLPTDFAKLILFKKALENIKLKPITAYIQEDGDARMSLSGKKMPTGPEIIFKLDSDVETIAGNLELALNTEPLLSNFKNKYSSLLYIDLRFGNKVYYKFR